MSMPPIVNFYEKDSDVDLQESGWDLGEMKADEASEQLEVRVWNNRGGDFLRKYEENFYLEVDNTDEFYVEGEDGTIELELSLLPEDTEEITVKAVAYTQEGQPTEEIAQEDISIEANILTITNYPEPEVDTRFEVGYYTNEDFKASQMRECSMYVRDEKDGTSQEVVAEGWVSAKCDSLGDTGFTILDADGEISIGAEGLQEEGEDPIPKIDGEINSGEETDINHYADVTLEMNVPYGASATENKPFYVYVRYFYT